MPDSSPACCRDETSAWRQEHALFERLVEAADRASDHQHSAST